MNKQKKRNAQVWVETVIYMLIGLTIMGLVLGVAIPKINIASDKAVLEQTVISLNTLNSAMMEVIESVGGNSREIELTIKRGEYFIDSDNECISFILKNTKYKYSQPDQIIKQGDMFKLTKDKGNGKYDVSLLFNYTLKRVNITYLGQDKNRALTRASAPYKILIRNEGRNNIVNVTKINIEQT